MSLLAAVNRLHKEHKSRTSRTQTQDYSQYRDDPIGFAEKVLKINLWSVQKQALLTPGCTLIESGHGVGKTYCAAVKVVHHYYTRKRSVAITTAPTEKAVKDLLWNEIRLLVKKAGLPNHFIGPSAAEMRDPEDPEEHWAQGYTAQKGESFQGRHRESMLFVFDEAEGIEKPYWTTTNSMYKPAEDHFWWAMCNPTTSTSQRYQERRAQDLDGIYKWNKIQFSCFEHPNIPAGLANRERISRGELPLPIPYPNAVTIEQINVWLGEWFEPISEDEAIESDIEYPPGSGVWYRPGPDGESRVLGRTPSAGTYGVWSEILWTRAIKPPVPLLFNHDDLPEIGVDVARFGDDRTEIHSRCGPKSLRHEDHGGWDTVKTAERVMELADQLAAERTASRDKGFAVVTGQQLRIKVDDTGVGGGVTDILAANGYSVVPVNAGNSAPDAMRYQRVRDQLWFETVERARSGRLDLSALPPKVLAKLEGQAMAPKKHPLPDRRWKVESKEETKKKVGRSPDGMDAVNLAYYEAGIRGAAEWINNAAGSHKSWRDRSKGGQ